ncbi:uncharacterized protein LOC135121209 [Zophobas morio]|uniref:uncharacterized protein LOC135121209 n=1 Tax=Zophobas morio TaxID=2755281 RepID=UPI0030829CCA
MKVNNFVPCGNKCGAFYCSTHCLALARELYHNRECSAEKKEKEDFKDIKNYFLTNADPYARLALRLALCGYKLQSLKKGTYEEIKLLIHHYNQWDLPTLLESLTTAMLLAHAFELFSPKDLFLHFLQVPLNSISLTVMHLEDSCNHPIIEQRNIGLAIYPFLSLVNHSCKPNSHLLFDGSTAILYTSSSFPEGTFLYIKHFSYYFY